VGWWWSLVAGLVGAGVFGVLGGVFVAVAGPTPGLTVRLGCHTAVFEFVDVVDLAVFGRGAAVVALVGVGPGRSVALSGGLFPRPAPPNRTCEFPRIRLSTGLCRVGYVTGSWFLDHGVGICVPR
jgi:hypothetical protein